MQNLEYLARAIKWHVVRLEVAAAGIAPAEVGKLNALKPRNDSGCLEDAKSDLIDAVLSAGVPNGLGVVGALELIPYDALPVCGRDDISTCKANKILESFENL